MTDEATLLSSSNSDNPTTLTYMLKLSAPMVISTISFTVMQFVDRFMVSRLGTDALAAIIPASFVSFIPGGFAIGAITSLNTFVSQSLGRGDKRDCSNYFWQAVYMGLVYFLLVVLIMWPSAPWIFRTLGHPSAVVEMEVIYLRIILYAHIMAVINWSSGHFFMGIHRPVITMCTSLCGQAVNVVVNYILIFGKLGFPRMGIAGAGWGTFIGIGTAAIINIVFLLGGKINSTYKTRSNLNVDFSKMYDLLKIGLPAGFGLMVNVAFWGVILTGLVGKFGAEALAATSAVFAYTSFFVMPVIGMSTALTAAVGKTIGEGQKKMAIKQTRVCLKVSLIYMGLVSICFIIFRNALMAFWSSDEKVIEIGINLMILSAFYQTFHATRTIYSGSLRGAGDTVWLAVVSTIGAVFILGLGGWLIARFLPSLGALGPWFAATLSIIAGGLANRWRFKSKRWMDIDLFKHRVLSVPIQSGAAVE
ncbi:MAG: MATE family efflux transporter [Sedimentisphaerales bacterium]|nr:MATE family efflux transporter [Sedimentisphaerales bacterium]